MNVEWGMRIDVFSGSKHESSAANYLTKGVSFRATKA
jgi:hypothetical protein